MGLLEHSSGSRAIGSTEWSLVADEAGPVSHTDAGVYQLYLDLNSLASGDVYRIRGYEKVEAAGNRRRFMEVLIVGPPVDPILVLPPALLMHGWDLTLAKVSGPTDRTVVWSVRRAI